MIAQDLMPPQRRAFERQIPYRAHVVLTHKCNLACAHCYQAEHASEDLTTVEVVGALEQLAKLGTTFLVLGGGEPLARRDFWEILAEAKRLRFVVELFTNAMLVDAEAANRLKEAAIARATVSLHGGVPLTHDVFVKRPGAFERVLRGIERLEAAGVPVMVRGNATAANHREAGLLALRFEGRSLVKFGGWSANLHARDDGDKAPQLYRVTEEQERGLVRAELARLGPERIRAELDRRTRARQEPESRHVPCQAARTGLAIQPNGDVTPCTQTTGHAMGNLRQRPIAELWRDSVAAATLRAIDLGSFTGESAQCADCRHRHVCERCPALSEQHSGSLTGWNPQTCQSTMVYWTELERRAAELGLEVTA